MSFKEATVVMLPTNQKAGNKGDIILLKQRTLVSATRNYIAKQNENLQHLYILSDEDIKEGDWCIPGGASPLYIQKWFVGEGLHGTKKIIATTDSSLVQPSNQEFKYLNGNLKMVILPKPSNSFISKFIEAYNQGKPITKVMVEYETIEDEKWTNKAKEAKYSQETWEGIKKLCVPILKVNPKDNTITIKRVKDSWNREELEKKCRSAFKAGGYHGIWNGAYSNEDKWIEDNL